MSIEDDDDCPACGSSLRDREAYAGKWPGEVIPTGFSPCPHCGSKKCCMCDMGDDVECLSCDNSED